MANLADGHLCASTAEVTLGSENLVIVLTEIHVVLLPSIEVVGGRDRAARALALTDAPELLERLGSVD